MLPSGSIFYYVFSSEESKHKYSEALKEPNGG
jgi:hypothetical protein